MPDDGRDHPPSRRNRKSQQRGRQNRQRERQRGRKVPFLEHAVAHIGLVFTPRKQ
jgi:hypothetical protein